jgi:hypothetical protein
VAIPRDAAESSRANLRRLLDDPTVDMAQFTTPSRGECRSRVDASKADPQSMIDWPLRYPSINQLILIRLFCAICSVFYRIIIVLAAVMAVAIVRKVATLVTTSGPGTAEETPAAGRTP